MNDDESAILAAEQTMTAEEFISSIAPMTATSGQVHVLREIGEITRQDAVLEIWCGAGDLTAQLAEISNSAVGADYSAKLVQAAQSRFPHVDFVVSETVNLPFDEEMFDVVVSNFTAHHFSTPAKNFVEARRVLKPGGRLLVTIPIQSKRIGFNLVLQAAREWINLPDKVITGGPLLDAESPDALIEEIRIAGFRHCCGWERTHYSLVDSPETLLAYAWNKIGLSKATPETQAAIRATSIQSMQPFLGSDGCYRFPDRLLAVRGIR